MTKKFSMALGVMLALAITYTSNSDDKKGPKLEGIKCPVSGKPVVANGTATHNGATVYFCCTNCPKAFAKDTAKFAAKANHQAVLTGQAKQVKCPLKPKAFKKTLSVDVAGVKVGFC